MERYYMRNYNNKIDFETLGLLPLALQGKRPISDTTNRRVAIDLRDDWASCR